MIDLSPDLIHIWFCFTEDIRDDRLYHQYRQLLSEDELLKEQRFHFLRDKHQYVTTRAMVRTVLSHYARVAPDQWSFFTNPYGRPEIANDDRVSKRISFSVSHTEGLIVLGVTNEVALGVDAEDVQARRVCLDIVDHFFSLDEITALRSLPTEEQNERFFQYWTLKESYIKACGMGLSIPLSQFSFSFLQNNRIAISFHPPLSDRASRWHFWQLRPSLDHIAVVCAEQFGNAGQKLIFNRIVPLEKDEIFNCFIQRESERADQISVASSSCRDR